MQVGEDMNYDNNELYHYGVRGMKWGVRKATKTLSSSKSTVEQREKAISSLQKHKIKASAKVAKLERNVHSLRKMSTVTLQKPTLKQSRCKEKLLEPALKHTEDSLLRKERKN